jgi:hypothetical protein
MKIKNEISYKKLQRQMPLQLYVLYKFKITVSTVWRRVPW